MWSSGICGASGQAPRQSKAIVRICSTYSRRPVTSTIKWVESTVVSLNGTIKSEEMHEEGTLVSEKASRNQAPVGTWKYYWPDGKTVKIKEEYENSLLNGTRLVYYQNGEKQVGV